MLFCLMNISQNKPTVCCDVSHNTRNKTLPCVSLRLTGEITGVGQTGDCGRSDDEEATLPEGDKPEEAELYPRLLVLVLATLGGLFDGGAVQIK